jgi:hypothetical protein
MDDFQLETHIVGIVDGYIQPLLEKLAVAFQSTEQGTAEETPREKQAADAVMYQEGDLLEATEVGALLNCDVSIVYELCYMGKLKWFSLKGAVPRSKRGKKGFRILKSSVQDYIATSIAENSKADDPPLPMQGESEAAVLLPVIEAKKTRARQLRPGRSKSRVVLPAPGQRR